MKRVAVILSGCGVLDGAEIHESVLTLLALDRAGAEAVCLAPDAPQQKVTNHRTGEDVPEARNILAESARIARGRIQDLAQADPGEYDGAIVPGGYGALVNLSDFGVRQTDCAVLPGVERFLRGMLERGRPVGALCIAPVLVARVLQGMGRRARLTVGDDPDTAEAIRKLGHEHVDCPATEIVVDRENRIVTTPCYMLARRISQVEAGVDQAVRALLDLA